MYSQLFWEHVRNPRNRGALPDAYVGEGHFHRCGDRMKLYLQVDDKQNITKATFEGAGCAPVIAVASLGTELLLGMEADTALHLNVFEMDTILGGIPPSKRHAFLIFLECLHGALQHLKKSIKGPKIMKKPDKKPKSKVSFSVSDHLVEPPKEKIEHDKRPRLKPHRRPVPNKEAK